MNNLKFNSNPVAPEVEQSAVPNLEAGSVTQRQTEFADHTPLLWLNIEMSPDGGNTYFQVGAKGIALGSREEPVLATTNSTNQNIQAYFARSNSLTQNLISKIYAKLEKKELFTGDKYVLFEGNFKEGTAWKIRVVVKVLVKGYERPVTVQDYGQEFFDILG